MQINLLGPLEVFRDGVLATPSAPKLRRVLSLLAINANNVVRTHQLIEELWENDPPASVNTTLQTYVYQLRKLLRLDAIGRPGVYRRAETVLPALRTSPGGYVLSLAASGLDALLFEQLAERGRAELDAGDLEATAATLAEALRLWRGPALADMSAGPMLQGEILRLEEIRRNALERRIDVDLRLGRHHEMLGELTGVAARQPTHEGFQAKLMLALYRSGRRAEALSIYQRTRSALADELGLDISDSLQRLHRAILDADRSLDLTASGAAVRISKAGPVAQLPPTVATLVGREQQLAEVAEMLSPEGRRSPAVVAVNGCPGIGKTSFLVAAAHHVRAAYPDGQFYAHLMVDGAPVDAGEVLAGFLRAAGLPDAQVPGSTDERSRMFRTWTSGRRVLIVLDDVVDDEQLSPLLPSNGDCAVLVAGRRRLSTDQVGAVELRPLTREQGVEMINNALGRQRIVRDRDAVPELARLCDGLPAALNAVTAQLLVRPHWTVRQLVERLRGRLPAPGSNGLARSVTQTYRLMSPTEQCAFRLLACAADASLSVACAAAILGVDEHFAECQLESVVEYQLIEVAPSFDDDGLFEYVFLPAIRSVGRSLQAEAGVPVQTDRHTDRRRAGLTAMVAPGVN